MATLEQRVERLERRQLKIWKRLRNLISMLALLANNGVLPTSAAAALKQQDREAESEAE